jgi:hypothetical protein
VRAAGRAGCDGGPDRALLPAWVADIKGPAHDEAGLEILKASGQYDRSLDLTRAGVTAWRRVGFLKPDRSGLARCDCHRAGGSSRKRIGADVAAKLLAQLILDKNPP